MQTSPKNTNTLINLFQNGMALTKWIIQSVLTQRVAPIMLQYVTNKIFVTARNQMPNSRFVIWWTVRSQEDYGYNAVYVGDGCILNALS